jgi:hypothetical protein
MSRGMVTSISTSNIMHTGESIAGILYFFAYGRILLNIIFFSFWETKARYAFGVTPVLLFLAFYSAAEIAAAVKEKLTK